MELGFSHLNQQAGSFMPGDYRTNHTGHVFIKAMNLLFELIAVDDRNVGITDRDKVIEYYDLIRLFDSLLKTDGIVIEAAIKVGQNV